MKFITRTLAILGVAIAGALCVTSAAHAADWGPPPGVITISCTELHMDPPSGVFVTYHVVINDDGVERYVIVEAENDDAVADISNMTLDTGPLHIVVFATWNLGTGNGPTFETTLTCHEPPTTTTSTSTTTVAPTTTTTTLVPEHQCTTPSGAHYGYSGPNPPCGLATTTTTTVTPQIGTPITAVRTAAPASLPNTGSDNGPVVELAACFILAGSVMIWKARRS